MQDAGRRPGHPRIERQQHLRRRDDGRPRGLRGAEPAQLAARQARRRARRGGLQGRRPVRREIRQHRRPPARRGRRSRRSRSRRRSRALVKLYETGLDSDREAFDIAWVQNRDSDGRHDERLHRGLHGRARHEGRMGRRRLLRQPREDRRRFARSPTHAQWFEDHLPIDPKYRKPNVAGRVGAGDRGGGRSRRLRADHADRRQPAERSAHPRGVRQQVGVALERARRLRALDARQLSARSLRGTMRRWSARSGGARLPAS